MDPENLPGGTSVDAGSVPGDASGAPREHVYSDEQPDNIDADIAQWLGRGEPSGADFGDGGDEGASQTGTPAEQLGSQPSTTLPGGQQGQPAAAPAEGSQATPDVTALQAALAAQQAYIAQLQQGQTQGQGQGQQSQVPHGPLGPLSAQYAFNVPDEMVADFMSADPAKVKGALATMAAGLAARMHESIVGQVSQTMPQYIQSSFAVHQQQQAIFQDFYGKYPQLKASQPLMDTVRATAMAMAQQNPNFRWTPQTRDAIAAAVFRQLGIQAPGAQQASPGASRNPRMPGTRTTGGARPAAAAPLNDQQRYMDFF